MTPRLKITRATAAEVNDLAPLFDGYRRFYGKPSEPDACAHFLNERISRNESVVFIGRFGDAAAGFTQLYPTFTSVGMARVWHLNDLFVAEGFRRRGAAKALMLHAIAFARGDGAMRVTLETQVENASARALYESLGMTLGTKFVKYAIGFE
ncbi:MAG TPA: GNAT family N-acetyltransferase [Phycisphaerales bacterium]|nr:GNAT family N-acetyltransferase [Phycisphaerales bacterium]